ncbi:MAG: MoaD/ThiS family protein [Gemmatimonadales bacterium]
MTVTSEAPVRVRLFARYAELLGFEELALAPPTAKSVGAVLAHLRALPGGDRLPDSPMVAVNLAHVRGDASLAPGDEVALLPPLAGG